LSLNLKFTLSYRRKNKNKQKIKDINENLETQSKDFEKKCKELTEKNDELVENNRELCDSRNRIDQITAQISSKKIEIDNLNGKTATNRALIDQ
jgi:predicted RNase H-like nuclease (RuvC/YqgF family)